MLKKITIAVLGLSASGLSIAGSMGPVCTPGDVTVPCEAKLWDLGVQAVYLKSIYGFDKGYELDSTLQNQEISNDWNWGYRIEGSYHFNTGNDVTVNWLHFSTSTDPKDYLGAIPVNGRIFQAPFDLVSRNRLDQVNVVMGQHTDLGQRDKMRFYGGMQYANIQSTSTNYYSTPALTQALGGVSFTLFDNTDYKGFGPVAGIDYSYDIANGLSVIANGSGSILYGTNRYHAGYVALPVNAIVAQDYASKKGIVPSLEAKLGLNYAYNMPQGVVNIEAGYEVMNYFNALQGQPLQNLAAPIQSVNYGLYGPYFGLKYVGNA